MRLIFFGKGQRGTSCLHAIHTAGYPIPLVVGHPGEKAGPEAVGGAAELLGIPHIAPDDPNDPGVVDELRALAADVFVLAGYGKILKSSVIELPRLACINLHGGKVPDYRGSSPMNWSLINGERSFTLSVLRVDSGIDSGLVLNERTFPIGQDTTIRDLHEVAVESFPEQLLETLSQLETGSLQPRRQPPGGSYYPLRFPEDGLILWDQLTAQQVHNRIRALTRPYPCAFSYWKRRRVDLLSSELLESDFFGEPGRIYAKFPRGLIVCAADRCLRVREAVLVDSGRPLADEAARYDQLATVRGAVLEGLLSPIPQNAK
jgi:methionyl-tRNA formyltransferase